MTKIFHGTQRTIFYQKYGIVAQRETVEMKDTKADAELSKN